MSNLIPANEARAQIEIQRSRFIAWAGPAFNVEEARLFIRRVKNEFPDANHHVPAFLIGHGTGVTAHCSDDGEPAGTAGRPLLVVLQGSGFGDIVIVVTRYFGGIKLGTGGLVRAYTEAAQEVLRILPRAEKVSAVIAMLVLPYTYLERIRQFCEIFEGQILTEEFGVDVTATIRFRDEKFDSFNLAVKNLTRGEVEAIIIERELNSIMPL
jgi:uncharacterized YigZ family protein